MSITELTSLLSRRSVYCSKYPTSVYSVVRFDNPEGNIDYKRIEHSWSGGRCELCGAPQKEYDRGADLESYAYEFIHLDNPSEVFGMKFDVIVGNPPYQLSDGGAQASATPIYNKFIEQAKKLNPRYMTMVIPARWFSGGKGLDSFRAEMINDRRIRKLHDFLNAADCFPGVEIKGGICYFLWDRDNPGLCDIVTHNGNSSISQEARYLQEDNTGVFIRHELGVSIYRKVTQGSEKRFSDFVSTQKPFGLRTFVQGVEKPFENSVKLYQRGGVGYISKNDVEKNHKYIDTWKIFISRAYNAGDMIPHQIIGKPILAEPGSCCTETYVMVGPFSSKAQAESALSYINTKFFRFMVSLIKVSQMAPAKVYEFVPMLDFDRVWNDEDLYSLFGLSEDEIEFIEAMIKPMSDDE